MVDEVITVSDAELIEATKVMYDHGLYSKHLVAQVLQPQCQEKHIIRVNMFVLYPEVIYEDKICTKNLKVMQLTKEQKQ